VRVRAALLWETGGESHRDDVLISDEHANGSRHQIVILDGQGRCRASSPSELPPGSILEVTGEASIGDLYDMEQAGYSARRPVDEEFEKRWAAAKAASREAAIEMAEAELAEIIARLEHELRRREPDLFDAEGRLIKHELTKRLLERAGGRTTLTYEDIVGPRAGKRVSQDDSPAHDAP
jgi:hypothetical protein